MATTRIEAEDLILNGYFITNGSFASDGQYIGLFNQTLFHQGNLLPGSTGTASYPFNGTAGTYTLSIGYYDEQDGIGQLTLQVDNTTVDHWLLDEDTRGKNASNSTFRLRTIEGIQLMPGEMITLLGTASDPAGEWARIDYLELTLTEPTPNPNPEPTLSPSSEPAPNLSPDPAPEPSPSSPNLAPGAIAFSTDHYRVNEDGTTEQAITVTRAGGSDGDVSVTVTPNNGTASEADYNSSPVTITFADGQTSAIVAIPITEDTDNESDETLTLSLGQITGGATLSNQSTATLTIVDNDETIDPPDIDSSDVINPPDLPIPTDPSPASGVLLEIEAEEMTLSNYRIKETSVASGGALISLFNTGYTDGSATTTFTGNTGVYNVELTFIDESDGNGAIVVTVGDDQATVQLNRNLGSRGISQQNHITQTVLSDVTVVNGEAIAINGFADAAEWTRVDKIAFIPVDGVTSTPDPVPTADPVPTLDSADPMPTPSSDPEPIIDPDLNPIPDPIPTSLVESGDPVTIEAEDMALTNYRIKTTSVASSNALISLYNTGYTQGSATTEFTGSTGVYDVELTFIDETDGNAQLLLAVGDDQATIQMNQTVGGKGISANGLLTQTVFSGITVMNGNAIALNGFADDGEWARVDKINFIPVVQPLSNLPSEPPAPDIDPVSELIQGNAQDNILNGGDGNQIIQPGAGTNTVNGGSGNDTISYDYDVAGVTVNLAQGIATRNFTTTDDTPVTILPLGDSNTRGFPNQSSIGGYRVELWQQLTNTYGFHVDFVGQAQSGPTDIDPDHEGRGGLTIDELTDNINQTQGFNRPSAPLLTTIENTLSVNGVPDVVLLMAGTNDFLQNDTVDNALNELGMLVDRITTFAPNTQVLVGSIIPNTSTAERELKTIEFSNRVEPEIIIPRVNQGDKVEFVDIFNAPSIDAHITGDGIHLTTGGYNILAQVWEESILGLSGGQDSLTNIENIRGSTFDDILYGDAGPNTIDGNQGNDELMGRGGADQFILKMGQGTDTILDFENGLDQLGLGGGLTFGAIDIVQGNGANSNNTLLNVGGETLASLVNVSANTITVADFFLA